ncbi:MAG: autotransporter domain-containing protein, partial [Thermoguttaceae bacterium]
VSRDNHGAFMHTLGVRVERSYFDRSGWLVNPSFSIGWFHDYGSGEESVRVMNFAGTQYTVRGASMNPNRLAIGLNVSVSCGPATSLFLRYDGDFCHEFQTNTIHGGFGLMF